MRIENDVSSFNDVEILVSAIISIDEKKKKENEKEEQ